MTELVGIRFWYVKMKLFGQLCIWSLLMVLFSALLCECKDTRWNTGFLPEKEVKRIKGQLKNINYLLFDGRKNEWHPLHRDDPIPVDIWNVGGGVKLIVHGYTFKHFQNVFEKLDEQNIWTLGTEYARQNKSNNVFIVDWTVLSTETLMRYYEASESTNYVGEDIARFLIRLSNESFLTDWDRLHIMGFSLGSHTVGAAGAKVQEFAGIKIGRITGLDPAGPNFDEECKPSSNLDRVLDKSDAKFVDVTLNSALILIKKIIHCNMKLPGNSIIGHLGSCVQAGHADFYPDGGESSSRCSHKDDVSATPCSHMMCPQLMKESLMNPVLACPCKDWNTFKEGMCDCTLETGGVLMGDSCGLT